MKNLTKSEWRQKHPKCKWCEYAKLESPSLEHDINMANYWECTIKDKIVNEELPRWLCKCFRLEERKNV